MENFWNKNGKLSEVTLQIERANVIERVNLTHTML